jgi:hypothetical protein
MQGPMKAKKKKKKKKGKYLAPAGSRTEDRPVRSLVNTDYATTDPGTLTVNTKMYTGFVRHHIRQAPTYTITFGPH